MSSCLKLFEAFPDLELILTIKDYAKADYEGNGSAQGFLKLIRDVNIKITAQNLDNAIVQYLKEMNVRTCTGSTQNPRLCLRYWHNTFRKCDKDHAVCGPC